MVLNREAENRRLFREQRGLATGPSIGIVATQSLRLGPDLFGVPFRLDLLSEDLGSEQRRGGERCQDDHGNRVR